MGTKIRAFVHLIPLKCSHVGYSDFFLAIYNVITLFSFAAQSLMERITKIIRNQFNIKGSCQNVDDVSHVFMSFVFVFRCILQEYGLTVLFLINCFMF